LDLVAAVGADVWVLSGLGDGQFDTPQVFAASTRGDVTALAVGDVDEVGLPDVVAVSSGSAGSTGSLSVLPADGSGGLLTAREAGANTGSAGVALADVDGDGHLDAVTSGTGVSVYLNPPGDLGGFAGTPDGGVALGSGATPVQVAAADLNGDDLADLAVTVAKSAGSDEMRVYQDTTSAPGATPTFSLAWQQTPPLPYRTPSAIALANVDGVGGLDLVVGVQSNDGPADVRYGGLLVWTNATPTVGAAPDFAAGPELGAGLEPSALWAGDLEGDGVVDLAAVNHGSATLVVHPGLGGGTFDAARELPLPPGASHVAAGDLDGDGRQDFVVAGDATGRLVVLLTR
jgi:hypothetical protein